jgi:hypothetical protein
MLRINKWKEIRSIYKTDSIAIVGNAPSVLNSKIGSLIDSSDCVIRMNKYQIREEYIPFIGKKTDIFVSNFYKSDLEKSFEDLKNAGVKMIWSSIPYTNYVYHWRQDLSDGNKYFHPYKIYVSNNYDFFRTNTRSDLYNFLIFSIYSILGRNILKFLGHRLVVPSTGLMSIIQAINLRPKKIIITGFDFFATDRAHYFSEDKRNFLREAHHRFCREPYAIKKFILKNPRINFYLAVDSTIKGIKEFRNYSNVQFYEVSKKNINKY